MSTIFLPTRAGSRLLRSVIALPGVILVALPYGYSTGGGTEVAHDLGLVFLIAAFAVPLWLCGSGELTGSGRWGKVLRRILRRTSGALLFGAVLTEIAARTVFDAGDSPASRDAAANLVGILAVALVLPLLEPPLRRLAPADQRRMERTARLAETLATVPLRFARLAKPDSMPVLVTGFDPDRGASGRPSAYGEYPGDSHRERGVASQITSRGRGRGGFQVRWTGTQFEVTDLRRGRTTRIPLASDTGHPSDRPGRPRAAVAELVLLTATFRFLSPRYGGTPFQVCSLLFLDDRGFRFLTVKPFAAEWPEILQVATAAGVPCAAYRFDSGFGSSRMITNLMFPRRITR